jgi:hypothetical protein
MWKMRGSVRHWHLRNKTALTNDILNIVKSELLTLLNTATSRHVSIIQLTAIMFTHTHTFMWPLSHQCMHWFHLLECCHLAVLWIQAFWDVTCQRTTVLSSASVTAWPSFETSGTTHPTERHIPKHLNPQQHCCENLKYQMVALCCIICFMLNCFFKFTPYLTANTSYLSFKNYFSPKVHTSYRTHNLVTIVGMTTKVQRLTRA